MGDCYFSAAFLRNVQVRILCANTSTHYEGNPAELLRAAGTARLRFSGREGYKRGDILQVIGIVF